MDLTPDFRDHGLRVCRTRGIEGKEREFVVQLAAPAVGAQVVDGRPRGDDVDQLLQGLVFQGHLLIRLQDGEQPQERLLHDVLGTVVEEALQVPVHAPLIAPRDLAERIAVPVAESRDELAVTERGSIFCRVDRMTS